MNEPRDCCVVRFSNVSRKHTLATFAEVVSKFVLIFTKPKESEVPAVSQSIDEI